MCTFRLSQLTVLLLAICVLTQIACLNSNDNESNVFDKSTGFKPPQKSISTPSILETLTPQKPGATVNQSDDKPEQKVLDGSKQKTNRSPATQASSANSAIPSENDNKPGQKNLDDSKQKRNRLPVTQASLDENIIPSEGEEDAIFASFFPQMPGDLVTPPRLPESQSPDLVPLVIDVSIPESEISEPGPAFFGGPEGVDSRVGGVVGSAYLDEYSADDIPRIEGQLWYNDHRLKGDFDSHYTIFGGPDSGLSNIPNTEWAWETKPFNYSWTDDGLGDGIGVPAHCYPSGECAPSIEAYDNYLSANWVLVELFEVDQDTSAHHPITRWLKCKKYERVGYSYIQPGESLVDDEGGLEGRIKRRFDAGFAFNLRWVDDDECSDGIIGNEYVIRFSLSNCVYGDEDYETGPGSQPGSGPSFSDNADFVGLCASVVRRTSEGDNLFQGFHPQASPDHPLIVGINTTQQGLILADAVFAGDINGKEMREWSLASNHFASLMETVNKFSSVGIDLQRNPNGQLQGGGGKLDGSNDWGAVRVVMCSHAYASIEPGNCSSGYAASEDEIWITEPEIPKWTSGAVVPHEFGHVVQRRTFDGTYGWPKNITSGDCPEDLVDCPYGRRDPDKMPGGQYSQSSYYTSTPPGWKGWSYNTYEWPKVAFKEGWGNFVANVGLNTCDQIDRNESSSYSHLSHVHPIPYQAISPQVHPIDKTFTDGSGYPGNVTNFLCDWYDSDQNDTEVFYGSDLRPDFNPELGHFALGNESTNDNDPNRPGYGDYFNANLRSMWYNLRQTWETASNSQRNGIQICDYVNYYLNDRRSAAIVGQTEHEKYQERIVNLLYNNGLKCNYDAPTSEFRNPDLLNLADKLPE